MSKKHTTGLIAALAIVAAFASPALASGGKHHHHRHHGHKHWNFHYWPMHYAPLHYAPYASAHRDCGFYYRKWKHAGGKYWKKKYDQCAHWR